MKNLPIVIALLVFVALLFVVLGERGKEEKAGVTEVKLDKIERDAITRFEIGLPAPKADGTADAAPATRKVILEKSGTTWTVADAATPDKKLGADDGLVKSALDATVELAMGDLVSNKADKLAGYEIDDARGQPVKVTAGDRVLLDVVFGRAAKGGGATVRLAGSNDVFIAKGRLGTLIKKDLAGWRKKALVEAKADEIVRVSTTLASGDKLVVEATTPPPPPAAGPDGGPEAAPAGKPEWNLVEPALPAGFRLDKTQLSRAAAGVSTLRAQDFADGVSDEAAGLTAPHTIVEASTRDGKKIVVHVGKEDDKKRVYLRLDGDPQLYLVAAYNAKQLQRGLDDLRDLSLLDAKLEDVEKVTVKGTTTVVVQRVGEAWKLVEPKTAPEGFDVEQIGNVVASLLRTRAVRLGPDAPKDAFAKVGPVLEVQLKGGKKQTIRFGAPVPSDTPPPPGAAPVDDKQKPGPREYYVTGSADTLSYIAAAFSRNRFDKPAELFKKPPAPPAGGMGNMGGGNIPGLDKLPPDVRRKLQESIQKGNFPPAAD